MLPVIIGMSILSKLRIETGKPLWLISCPEDCESLFSGPEIKKGAAGKQAISQVVFFALNKKELDSIFPKLADRLEENAVCWIAYPKKSSGITSDLVRDEGWGIVEECGYQFVSSVSIDSNWTGMRLRKPAPNAAYKRNVPMEERKMEGIDYVNREVTLPGDAVEAMKPHKGLTDFFYTLSFSHKREYVEAIAEAKKEETRKRRIDKMIEMLLKVKEEKENKKKK